MPSSPTKLQRWLDLVSYLASRRFPVATADLWAHVPAYAAGVEGSEREKQTVRRMFERDKDELRAAGIPIETVSYSINYGQEQQTGYRLARKDFHLPYLKLLTTGGGAGEAGEGAGAGAEGGTGVAGGTERPAARGADPGVFEVSDDEAGAALDGLRELAGVPGLPLAPHARSAFRKLAFDLPPELVSEPSVLHYAEDPEVATTRTLLAALSEAIGGRREIRFRYRVMSRDEVTDRHARPYGLLFQHGRWYLVGHDLDREAERMYRVGRMSELRPDTPAAGTPDFAVPEDFSLAAYAGRKAWELGKDAVGPVRATVRFRFPRSLWAERNGHGELVTEDAGGDQVRAFDVHRRDPFLRWVLSLAGDAWVEAPAELRDAFRALAARVADLHRGEAGP